MPASSIEGNYSTYMTKYQMKEAKQFLNSALHAGFETELPRPGFRSQYYRYASENDPAETFRHTDLGVKIAGNKLVVLHQKLKPTALIRHSIW